MALSFPKNDLPSGQALFTHTVGFRFCQFEKQKKVKKFLAETIDFYPYSDYNLIRIRTNEETRAVPTVFVLPAIFPVRAGASSAAVTQKHIELIEEIGAIKWHVIGGRIIAMIGSRAEDVGCARLLENNRVFFVLK